jgi:PAS domain S-box-containing protein
MRRMTKVDTRYQRSEKEVNVQCRVLETIFETQLYPFSSMMVDVNDYSMVMSKLAAGVHDASVPGGTCYSLLHGKTEPCNYPDGRCPIAQVQKTRQSATIEHLHYDTNNNARYTQVYCHPIMDADGNLTHVILILIDVTLGRQAQEQYTLLAEHSADVILRYNIKNGRFVYVSPSVTGIFGYAKDEAIYLQLKDVLTPGSCARQREIIQRDIDSGIGSRMVQLDAVHKDGHVFPVEAHISIVRDEDGKPAETVSVVRDVTERVKAEKARQESEEHARDLSENANDLIQSVGPDSRFLYVNRAWEKALGYTKEELVSLTLWDIIHPDSLQHCQKAFQRVMNGETVGNMEVAFVNRQGKQIMVEGNINSRRKDGEAIATRGIFRDITERKQMEEELKRRLEFEKAIAMVSSRFVGQFDIDEAIHRSLGDIGRLSRADRAYVFLFNNDGATADNTHEWCVEGITPQIENLQNLPLEAAPWWMEKLRRNELINIIDVARMPAEASAEQEILQSQGIRSVMVLPLNVADRLIGFVGLDNVTGAGEWTEGDLSILRVFMETIGSGFERRDIENALRLKESAIESSINGIALGNLQGNLTYVNPSFLRMWGYDDESEVLGRPSLEFWETEEDAKKVIEELQVSGSYWGKLVARKKNGTTFHIQLSASTVTDDKGKPVSMMASFVDIDENEQMERELRLRAELLDNSTDSVFVFDNDGYFIYVNEAAYRTRGYTREEIIGAHISMMDTPENAKKIESRIAEIKEKGFAVFESVHRRKDGSLMPVEINCRITRVAGKTLGLSTVRDITERKRMETEREELISAYREQNHCLIKMHAELEKSLADTKDTEAALKESEEKLSSILNNMEDGVWSISWPDFRHRFLSPSLEKLYGRSAQEFYDNPALFMEATHPDDRHLTEKAMEQLQEEGEATRECRVVRPDGSIVWVCDRSHMIYDENHQPIRVDGLTQDITERKLADEKLISLYQSERVLREDLESEMRKRTEFTRALVHELKTPLTPVIASCDLLNDLVEEEPMVSVIRNIQRGAWNLNRRIDELLDLARGEIGMLKLHPRRVCPATLLRETVTAMEAIISSQRQTLTLDLPPSLPEIRADETRVRQVVSNLLSNASKFMPAGGNITLGARQENGSLVVSIKDTGPGLSEEEQERVFQPYHRVERDRDRLSGLGLGLALSKTLIELHDGKIWVESIKGRGCTFAFSLPLNGLMPVDSKNRGEVACGSKDTNY